MIVILIYVVISQVLLQKDELWIERNSTNYQLSDGNYHIFRKYQIDGQVHHIQEYREKFSYYLFILTSQDNYFSLISIQDPADDFRKQTIFRAQNQSCDDKFVITQFQILWRCHTSKDIYYLYNLQTKLYKVNKLKDVSDKYFIFDFKKLIRYSNKTLRLYNINDNQLFLLSQFDQNYTILDHFDNQQNAILISESNIYIIWYKFEDLKQTNQLEFFQYDPIYEYITDINLLFFDYANYINLIRLYHIVSQKEQSISWLVNYQSDHPLHMSICQVYNRDLQNLLVFYLKNTTIIKNIQINDSAIPFINLYTYDLYLFHNGELEILVEVNYKSYSQPDYPALHTHTSIKEIKNSKYIYQKERQFAFLLLNQKGSFPFAQIHIGGDITYSYQQMDQFDKMKINFKTKYISETINYQCINGIQIQNIYLSSYFICQQYNNSFTIQFIGKIDTILSYYYDQIINFRDYLLYTNELMFIAIQQERVLYVYNLNKREKTFIIKFYFDEIDFEKNYAFILYNGNVLKYDFIQNETSFLDSHLFGYKIQIDNNFYAYKDSKLIIANQIKDTFIVYQNFNLNSQILRMYIFQYQILIISQNQIKKFEKINSNRVVLIGNIELYGNIINENSTIVSNQEYFIYIINGRKLFIINTQLSLSQALAMSFEMEVQCQLLFATNERLCFRVDSLIQCQKLDPQVQYSIDFYSNEKYYRVQIQLESSNKYDAQRYNQVVEVLQTHMPMKILNNKTISLNSSIDLGREWYQGSVIQIVSNNYEILKYIREKIFIQQLTYFLNAYQQQGDYIIFYLNYQKLLLYNLKNHTIRQIKYPEQYTQALVFQEYILYSSYTNQMHIYLCEQFENCNLVKSIQMDDQFFFNYDSIKYISIRYVTKLLVVGYMIENLTLQQVFQYKQSLYSDYYYDQQQVFINFEKPFLTIRNKEEEITFNEAFKNLNQSSEESVYKIKILNENHFLVSFKRQGIFIYHFGKNLSVKYNLFPQKYLRKPVVTNVIQQGNEYSFGIQTEDNYVLIYKVVLDNKQFENAKIIEPEIQLQLDNNYYIRHFQLLIYEQFYYIVMQDTICEQWVAFQISIKNILMIDENYKNTKLKIRISDLEKFETMELTIIEQYNYSDIFLFILPIIYIILRFREIKQQQK